MAATAWLLAISAACSAAPTYLSYQAPVSRVVLDLPQSPDIIPTPQGNFRILYRDPQGARREWLFIPASKARGTVSVTVSLDRQTGTYTYHYRLQVPAGAPSRIQWFCVSTADDQPSGITTPPRWHYLRRSPFAPILLWAAEDKGLPPGAATSFSFASPHAPAAGTFYLMGESPAPVADPPGTGEWMYDPRPLSLFRDAALGDTVAPVGPVAAAPYAGEWLPLSSSLGAGWRLTWDPVSRTVTAVSSTRRLRVQQDNAAAVVDGHPLVLSAPPRLDRGALLVPASDLPRLCGDEKTR